MSIVFCEKNLLLFGKDSFINIGLCTTINQCQQTYCRYRNFYIPDYSHIRFLLINGYNFYYVLSASTFGGEFQNYLVLPD